MTAAGEPGVAVRTVGAQLLVAAPLGEHPPAAASCALLSCSLASKGVLHLLRRLLHIPLHAFGGTFSLQLLVVGCLADLFLDLALHFFYLVAGFVAKSHNGFPFSVGFAHRRAVPWLPSSGRGKP